MSLIDSTYFVNEISLPNNRYSDLTAFIDRYEKDFLLRTLGYDLYKLISEYSSSAPGESPQRIRDIVEGKEFQLSPYTYKWNGLINSDKVSPIAYYVYYHYMRRNATQTTTTGEVDNTHENANNTSISVKVSNAWNEMHRLLGQDEYIHGHWLDLGLVETYTEYYNSMYFFLSHHFDSYPEWQFQYLGHVNRFDL